MPPYLTHAENWKAIWPLFLTAVLLSALFFILIRPKEERKDFVLIVLAFSMLGLVAGYMTGFSRQAAIGAVLPAVLSLMGGLAVYLLGKDKSIRAIVAISVLAFSVSLVIGTGWGAIMRDTAEEYKRSEAYLKQRAYIEAEIQNFRNNLGLPPERLTNMEINP